MKAKEVHKLSDEELALETGRLRKRLFELRQQAVTEKIADTSQFRKIRKDAARVLTEVNARRIKTEQGAGKPAPSKPHAKSAKKSAKSASKAKSR